MRNLRIGLVILSAFLLVVGLSSMSYAFHSGGVADCDGCHTMHGAVNGSTVTPSTQTYLLQGATPSETCLNCHGKKSTDPAAGYHVMTTDAVAGGNVPVNLTPGGDFGWLLETYNYTLRGTATTENGETHGHNVIAPAFNLQQDSTFTTSPGGNFQSSNLACISCHDPHGKYRRVGTNNQNWSIGTPDQLTTASLPISGQGSTGNAPTATAAVGVYRILAGLGYTQNNGAIAINYPGVPIAVQPGTSDASGYNQAETAQNTQVRIAYGNYSGSGATTWGQWCGTCHGTMITGADVGGHVHPVDVRLDAGGENTNYNAYISSGNMTGLSTSAYLSLVPFFESTSDIDLLKSHANNNGSYLNGPNAGDQVSCLSCHRAHASGFPNMMRWNMENEFLTLAGPVWQVVGPTTQGRTTAEANAAYNGRAASYFGPYQRSLCNKCHAKD